MTQSLLLVAQVVALFAINEVGYSVARALHLPVPGNLLGMALLLALLATGIVPLRWVEASASLLIRHLAFFFIPITVGLVAFTDVFVEHGAAIVATLVISAGIGILVVGLSTQTLGARSDRKPS